MYIYIYIYIYILICMYDSYNAMMWYNVILYYTHWRSLGEALLRLLDEGLDLSDPGARDVIAQYSIV